MGSWRTRRTVGEGVGAAGDVSVGVGMRWRLECGCSARASGLHAPLGGAPADAGRALLSAEAGRPSSPLSCAPSCLAASEDELRYALGLANLTTGKGKVDLKDSNIRPIEIFMCSVVSATPLRPRCHDARNAAPWWPPRSSVLGPLQQRACAQRRASACVCRRCGVWATAKGSAGCLSTSSEAKCFPLGVSEHQVRRRRALRPHCGRLPNSSPAIVILLAFCPAAALAYLIHRGVTIAAHPLSRVTRASGGLDCQQSDRAPTTEASRRKDGLSPRGSAAFSGPPLKRSA